MAAKILIPRAEGIFPIAAETFAGLWEKVTGTALETVTEADAESDLIVMGSDASNPFTHAKIIEKAVPEFALRTGTDEYAIRSAVDGSRNLLFFAGGRPRALLYAIYNFFELSAGCHYFWDGDVIPHQDEIVITGYDVKESPRFDYRGLRYFAHRSLDRFQAEHWGLEQWKKEIDWILKKRMNMFMLRIGLDDLFQKAFPEIVSYPKWDVPEAKPRSYDDRNLFWSLEYRGQLRKELLSYARERDLMHPEDLGTMTHWYSRTPYEYLDKVKPDFMPQSTQGYGEKTGLVWDIRQEKNLDAYFKLTETHIREYGSPELFHTIGLAERRCYEDQAANHEMKLYTYRRIISKLRSKYPLAPLFIASWDFCMYWTPEQVRDLVEQLDPGNTIILDYTSDTDDELRNFLNWDLIGKFPWIFGFFHAFENESEMRGNYEVIQRRLPMAAADPMCKGLILWPELSHSDTLMLEYLAANGWNPAKENIAIEKFVDKFCSQRYGTFAAVMAPIWHEALPAIKARHWNGPRIAPYSRTHYNALTHAISVLGEWSVEQLHRAVYVCSNYREAMKTSPSFLRKLAELDLADAGAFVVRDTIDLARMAAARAVEYSLFSYVTAMEAWRNGTGDGDKPLTCLSKSMEIGGLLYNIISASKEFSLYASLQALQDKHETNPNFEVTLKGNAENGYCRTQVSELVSNVYLPELTGITSWVVDRIASGNKAPWTDARPAFLEIHKAVQEQFYKEPLENMAPDRERAFADLPKSITRLAEVVEELNKN